MRFAYAKLGRSVIMAPRKWGEVGGDNEPLELLLTLARRHPEHTWVVAGRSGGWEEAPDLPPNIERVDIPRTKPSQKWDGGSLKSSPEDVADAYRVQVEVYNSCDGAVIWLGQHGTSNIWIPQDKDPTKLTSPQESFITYSGHIVNGLNWNGEKYEPVYLCADARNYLKARDLKWYPTHPILGQYEFTRTQGHYRWGDQRDPEQCNRPRSRWKDDGTRLQWECEHDYAYSGLELTGVPLWEHMDLPGWEERVGLGMIINEARAYVNPAKTRAVIMRDWVMPLEPDFVRGKWSPKGMEMIGCKSKPVHYTELAPLTATAKCTLTTPSSGSGWATAKWWEMAALGVICFAHPFWDDQGHVIPTAEQVKDIANEEDRAAITWLRPTTPEEFKQRVEAVTTSKETYEWLADWQRRRLSTARTENQAVRMIESRLGLTKED